MIDRKSKLIQGLEEYLANTSEEQLKKDWAELEQYNQYGPEMEDCLELGRQHCKQVMKNMEIEILIDKFHKYNDLKQELCDILYTYVQRNKIRPNEEFSDFMLMKDNKIAIFFINEYGEPSLTYHSVKIEDLINIV